VKVRSFFQRFTSAIISIAIVFGFLVSPAFADVNFSAPNAAKSYNSYFTTGLEVGIIYSDDNTNPAARVLMCNNKYAQGAGPEWKSTCTSSQSLPVSTKLRVQGYYKVTGPGAASRNCAIPSYIPTAGGFVVNWISNEGTALGQTTITGAGLTSTGMEVCKSNGLKNINPPNFAY
jgi:hypothetical protein